MNSVQQIVIEPFYKKENGMLVYRLDDSSIQVPFTIRYQTLIYIPPGIVGGNHKHSRQEAFLGSSNLEFAWIDERGMTQRIPMFKEGRQLLIVTSPFVPHAVINISTKEIATLVEYADDPTMQPERVVVV